jgi:hypothetical protein
VFDENAQSIAYSGIFSECFEKTMDLHNGEIETREMLSYLDSIAGTPEGELFRPYIEASWGAGTES